MLKRVMLCLTALAALTAFAAPAAQGALLTDKNGPVQLSSEITMTNSNLVTTLPGNVALSCKVTLHGYLWENYPNVYIPSTTVTTSGCQLNGVLPATLTEPKFDGIYLTEGLGEVTTTFKYDVPFAGLANCHLEGSPELTYESGSDVVSIATASFVFAGAGNPAGCPVEGMTEGSFTLQNSSGPITID